jgi:hypothetical protein
MLLREQDHRAPNIILLSPHTNAVDAVIKSINCFKNVRSDVSGYGSYLHRIKTPIYIYMFCAILKYRQF